jgi:hypothetical protein
MEKKVTFITLSVIIFLSVAFLVFILIKLNGEDVIIKQGVNKILNNKNANVVQSSSSVVELPKLLVGQQKTMTAEEKKKLGLWDGENVQAVTRDINGNVTSYEFVINPDEKDSDNDGLSDDDEARIGTNPNNPDTDGDGMSDLEELRIGHNPLVVDDYSKK